MTIRKKTKEELLSQAEWFLDYAEEKWKITKDKAGEIIWILTENDEIIEDEASIKNSLLWVLSSDEFDELYLEYKKDYLKVLGIVKKLDLFPEWYKYLNRYVLKYLFVQFGTISQIEEWSKEATDEDLLKVRENIKNNIVLLESSWIDVRDIQIECLWYDEMGQFFQFFKDKGIEDEFVKLQDLVIDANSSTIEKIQAFGDVWIKTADDFIALKDLINNPNVEVDRIKVFWESGFNKVEDFINLTNLLYTDAYDDNDKMNNLEKIKLFWGLWIRTVDDFLKLEEIIKDISIKAQRIKILWDAGIRDADGFLKLRKEVLINYNDEDIIRRVKKIWYAKILQEHYVEILGYRSILGFIYENESIDVDSDVRELASKYHEYSERFGDSDWWLDYTFLSLYNQWYSVDEIDTICKGIPSWYLNSSVFSENIKIVFEKFWKISPDKLGSLHVLFCCNPKNLQIVLNKYSDMELEDLDAWKTILIESKSENLKIVLNHYQDIKIEDIVGGGSSKCIENMLMLSYSEPENLKIILNKYQDIDFDKLASLLYLLMNSESKNLKIILDKYQDIKLKELVWLDDILAHARSENLKLIFDKYPDIKIVELTSLKYILENSPSWRMNLVFKCFDPIEFNELQDYETLFTYWWGLPLITDFADSNHKWYLKYINQIIWEDTGNSEKYGVVMEISKRVDDSVKYRIIQDISKLWFEEIDNYLFNLNEFLKKDWHTYSDFLKCYNGETLNVNAVRLLDMWFNISWPEDISDVEILNSAINQLYPKLSIKFNEKEAEKILWFIGSIWWINKWYSILILTMEKLVRDWVDGREFNRLLFKKLEGYKRVLDMYPEGKIPEWLKMSVWLEFEITKLYNDWYKNTTRNDYQNIAELIVEKAKLGKGKDWIIEFSTKPSTNPLVTLLEIHLLQELNLLDINDMQKLSWDVSMVKRLKDDSYGLSDFDVWVDYNSRNWTWYHLNIWSDGDMSFFENVYFIQNLCTMLPRSWISNGGSIKRTNRQWSINSKSSIFSVFSGAKSRKYVELRTYNVDDVELFEKNVLFNTYGIMWSQAQKKVSLVDSKIILSLRDDENINNVDDLMNYLESKNLFKNNQDLKSKKIAAEFMFMQIGVLRVVDDYNRNFIDNELFFDEVFSELSDSWKNFLYDLLLSDQKETIWFEDKWLSNIVVKRHAINLYNSFDENEYVNKETPLTYEDVKQLLNRYWDNVDEKWTSYVIRWVNKKLLWRLLCEKCRNRDEEGWSERLENVIRDKVSNIDRVKSYLRMEMNDKNLEVNREFLRGYFMSNMSLADISLYEQISVNFANRIIALNNFFLKKDDTNANGVLQTTVLNGDKDIEEDISKSSIFETWYMRKWYNYYQWWSENMLLHAVQKIALNYMENVRNILNMGENNDNKKLN